ncbi:hypothetical protein JAAARDRAFT_535377 [Jaapia argillacea MUCL 33604]|uniref:Uncharacterized protein n=1 Tax=Jaapia argillacea MUCL 33604 TaxID=933084 RepID=A0A067PBK9_9AGAM|nr:hypothetical protein JAAARDRAFT_535377 [Jaapia argillacea MUCL 33604]
MSILPAPGNPPPPRPRVTWYRLIFVSFIVGFAIPKWVLASRNFQESANDVDFISSLVVTAGLVVAGWWESDPPRRLRWFFETDWGVYPRYWRKCSRILSNPPHSFAFYAISGVYGICFLWIIFIGFPYYFMRFLDSVALSARIRCILCVVFFHLLSIIFIVPTFLAPRGGEDGIFCVYFSLSLVIFWGFIIWLSSIEIG